MKEIGGFFELELRQFKEFHTGAMKLNTGRNCLEYILRARNYKKIHIPYFICEVILEPIKKLHIEYSFYNINENFEPLINDHIKENEAFLYVNYFGIKQQTVDQLSKKIKNLIIDNTQAFYAECVNDIDTFYSPRKFFGLPDGGYLYTNKILNIKLEKDISYERMNHLLKRIDVGSQAAYLSFKENSEQLKNKAILEMSNLTQQLLKGIDYKRSKLIREQNFLHLHNVLEDFNILNINTDDLNGPMVYPFMTNNDNLRQHLINNKVFVATYWTNVFTWSKTKDLEYKLSKYILPLPIDQRYNKRDISKIIQIILDIL